MTYSVAEIESAARIPAEKAATGTSDRHYGARPRGLCRDGNYCDSVVTDLFGVCDIVGVALGLSWHTTRGCLAHCLLALSRSFVIAYFTQDGSPAPQSRRRLLILFFIKT